MARGLELRAPARSLGGAWQFLAMRDLLMTVYLQLELPGPSPKGLGLEFDSQAQGQPAELSVPDNSPEISTLCQEIEWLLMRGLERRAPLQHTQSWLFWKG